MSKITCRSRCGGSSASSGVRRPDWNGVAGSSLLRLDTEQGAVNAMPREITAPDGIKWTCIQAFSGLGNNPEKTEAARVNGEADAFQVVCTPSGGAKSVRIELPADWEQKISEEELLDMIQTRLDQAS
jgi:hypothetical protein